MFQNQRKNEDLLKWLNYSKYIAGQRTKQYLNTVVEVLIEKESKKSKEQWSGRTPQNTVVVSPKRTFIR